MRDTLLDGVVFIDSSGRIVPHSERAAGLGTRRLAAIDPSFRHLDGKQDITARDAPDSLGISTGMIEGLSDANARASANAHALGVVADLASPDSES